MKVAQPKLPPLLEDGLLATMVRDGELEDARLHDEDGAGLHIPALELSGVMFEKVLLTGVEFAHLNARDVIFRQTDLSSASLADGSINRAHFVNCRLTGIDLSKTSLHDVVFQGCKLDMANYRFADLRRVQFIDCTFVEADFLGASLHEVTFERCRLERTMFEQVKAANTDFRTSELVEVSGWRYLKGITIDTFQLATIAPYLAHELGLTVRD